MVLADFVKSAEASAKEIAQENLTVGARIFNAVNATQNAVGMNTNLGIILLCAPLIQAAYLRNADVSDANQIPFEKYLQRVLNNLTEDDAVLAAQAIVLANPAGLSQANAHDVHAKPSGFADILGEGITSYQEAMQLWENHAWATTWVYVNFLAAFEDTHITRKLGEDVAKAVRKDAVEVKEKILASGHPKLEKKRLLDWDASLKKHGVNPGTSADLTVTTLLMNYLCKHL
jgi:triphosphoribosyl-dephospho-CoA synthase